MEYVRKVDFAAIARSGANERLTQKLFDHTSGAKTCTIYCIKTPAPRLAIAIALVFVMSFTTFPSAILLGQPTGATRTIAIAAYARAFEMFDMPYASAIAVIIWLFQLAGLLVIILLRKRMVTAATMGIGKR